MSDVCDIHDYESDVEEIDSDIEQNLDETDSRLLDRDEMSNRYLLFYATGNLRTALRGALGDVSAMTSEEIAAYRARVTELDEYVEAIAQGENPPIARTDEGGFEESADVENCDLPLNLHSLQLDIDEFNQILDGFERQQQDFEALQAEADNIAENPGAELDVQEGDTADDVARRVVERSPGAEASNTTESTLAGFSAIIERIMEAIKSWLDGFGGMFGSSSEEDEPGTASEQVGSGQDLETRFDNETNPLNESGETDSGNIMRIPRSTSGLNSLTDNSRDSWVRDGDEVIWVDDQGLELTTSDVAFILRDGYNPSDGATIEQFLDNRMIPVNFAGNFGVLVHPVLAARLANAQRALDAAGISYTTPSIDGYSYRSINGNEPGRLSNHALGLAIDFNKDTRHDEHDHDHGNLMANYGDNLDDYFEHVDYSREFFDIMTANGFRNFWQWVARSGGIRDTMHFDLNPNLDGTIPFDFNIEEQSGV